MHQHGLPQVERAADSSELLGEQREHTGDRLEWSAKRQVVVHAVGGAWRRIGVCFAISRQGAIDGVAERHREQVAGAGVALRYAGCRSKQPGLASAEGGEVDRSRIREAEVGTQGIAPRAQLQSRGYSLARDGVEGVLHVQQKRTHRRFRGHSADRVNDGLRTACDADALLPLRELQVADRGAEGASQLQEQLADADRAQTTIRFVEGQEAAAQQ